MTLAVAIQMDPIEGVNPQMDTSFVMAVEAQRRGFELFIYTPDTLSLHVSGNKSRATAEMSALQLFPEEAEWFVKGAPEAICLDEMDVVLLRQDPPFDLGYIATTHILEHTSALVINDPVSVRNAPEKLLVTHFQELCPPTLITRNMADILEFSAEYPDIILKPLNGNGGAGVVRVRDGDGNLTSLIESYATFWREPMIVQKFAPEVCEGDKRIILIEGEPVGAVTRMPSSTDNRANFHAGGQATSGSLSDRDREICTALAPTLRSMGLVFTGIDIIGPWLTEINVTSPTGVQEINRLEEFEGRARIESLFWDAVLDRLEAAAFSGDSD